MKVSEKFSACSGQIHKCYTDTPAMPVVCALFIQDSELLFEVMEYTGANYNRHRIAAVCKDYII